eukprot:Polyplicarium_translucidae@DN631_c0_g1_i1.p1
MFSAKSSPTPSCWRCQRLPFDAEMDSLKKSLSTAKRAVCTRQRYLGVRRDLECIAAYINAHEEVVGRTERSTHAIKSILNEEFFDDLRLNLEQAKAFLKEMHETYGQLYDAALLVSAAHLLLNEKQAIVERFAKNGALLHEDAVKVQRVFEEQHEALRRFTPGRRILPL